MLLLSLLLLRSFVGRFACPHTRAMGDGVRRLVSGIDGCRGCVGGVGGLCWC